MGPGSQGFGGFSALSGSGPLVGRGGYDTGVSVLAISLRFVIWVLVIVAVVWLVRAIIVALSHRRALTPPLPNPAVAELEMMYARGEVTRIDYLTRRADLSGVPPPMIPAS
jgi:hypothetical protein